MVRRTRLVMAAQELEDVSNALERRLDYYSRPIGMVLPYRSVEFPANVIIPILRSLRG